MTQDTNLDLDLELVELGAASELTEGPPYIANFEEDGSKRDV